MSIVKNKVAIVSGAAQGIGRSIAETLAEAGAKVLAFDVQPQIEEIFADNASITTLVADVSQRADVEPVIDAALKLGDLDILINNAGRWKQTPVDSPWEQALEDWDTIMDTNLKGVLMLSRAAVPHLQASGGGDIINLSTYYVLPAKSAGTNPPGTDLYNASKWALNGFTDAWAKYLQPHNIRVNGLCMGATDTPMLRGLFPNGEYPPGLKETVMPPSAIAQQLLALLEDGRSGENVGAWVGEPVVIPEPAAAHKRITG